MDDKKNAKNSYCNENVEVYAKNQVSKLLIIHRPIVIRLHKNLSFKYGVLRNCNGHIVKSFWKHLKRPKKCPKTRIHKGKKNIEENISKKFDGSIKSGFRNKEKLTLISFRMAIRKNEVRVL